MTPRQFTEVLCECQEELGGADQARVYASGSVDNDFYVAVVDNARTNETEVVIASQEEGDDTSAVYPAKAWGFGPRLANIALTMEKNPLRSSLSLDDTAKLGRMAASSADPDHMTIVVPEQGRIVWSIAPLELNGRGGVARESGLRGRTDSTVHPNRFMGRPIKPLSSRVN